MGPALGPKSTRSCVRTQENWVLRQDLWALGPHGDQRELDPDAGLMSIGSCQGLQQCTWADPGHKQGSPSAKCRVRVWLSAQGTTAPPKLKLTIFSSIIPSMSNASQWKDNPTTSQLFILKKSKNIRPKLWGLAATMKPRVSSLFNLSTQTFIFFNFKKICFSSIVIIVF